MIPNLEEISARLNHCLSILLSVNHTDLSGLARMDEELKEIAKSDVCPKDLVKWTERTCALLQSTILGEVDFETGISRLSTAIADAVASIDESLKRGCRLEVPDNDTSANQDDNDQIGKLDKKELQELRRRFVKNQIEVINSFEAALLEMEKGVGGSGNDILRILHTWKGEFNFLELPEYSQAIHSVEEAINKDEISIQDLIGFRDALQKNMEMALESGDFPPPPSIPLKKNPDETNNIHKPVTRISIDLGHIEDNSILDEFIVESVELLHNSEIALLDLESAPEDREMVNTVFRAYHTVKGSAGFLGLAHVQSLAHAMEDVLSRIRDRSAQLTGHRIETLLRGSDILRETLEAVKKCAEGEEAYVPERLEETIRELRDERIFRAHETSGIQPVQGSHIGEILVNDGVVDAGTVEQTLKKQKNGDTRKTGEILVEDAGVKAYKVANALSRQKSKKLPTAISDTIRISVEKLDALIDSIGEAVIAQAMLNDDPVVKNIKSHTYQKKVQRAAVIMRSIQEQSMSLRMVSIKPTFQKMARVVRDLSIKNGKTITLRTEGEETELDKTVVENIRDPLMHMIRNAADHGIETPRERLAAGKPENGTIVLRAYHRGGGVFIETEDDGRGLDRDVLLQKAVEKGLCRKDARLSDQEIYQFIFDAGFSTAGKITEISGRGVGMDVVRKNISELRGSVDIQSVKHKGTTFTIRLPLTLAIVDALVVNSNGNRYLVPILSVVECVTISRESFYGLLDNNRMVRVREEFLPYFDLACIFDKKMRGEDKLASAGIIVEDSFGGKAIIGVDAIESQQQVVIKSLGSGVGNIEGVSGGAIMSDGSVSLILDAAAIIRMADLGVRRCR